jgi:hypothetical protein
MRTTTALSRQQVGATRRAVSFLDVSRAFLSSRVPERAPEGRGWSGLAGWMKTQIRAKSRNRGHDWAVFHRPDEKKGCRDLVGLVSGDALRAVVNYLLHVCLIKCRSTSYFLFVLVFVRLKMGVWHCVHVNALCNILLMWYVWSVFWVIKLRGDLFHTERVLYFTN